MILLNKKPLAQMKDLCLYCGITREINLYSDTTNSQVAFVFAKTDWINHKVKCYAEWLERTNKKCQEKV